MNGIPLPSGVGEVRLLPYCEVDGIRTFKDSEISYLFTMIQKENKVEDFFCDGSVQSGADLVSLLKSQDIVSWIIIYKEEIRGLLWLNRFRSTSATIQIIMLGRPQHNTLRVAKEAMEQVMHLKDTNDNYVFSVLKGFTLAHNFKTLELAKKIGFTLVGKIPNLVYHFYDKKYYDAIISYLVRRELS